MKILTITCHRPMNYGAVLQAYALQQFIIEKGHDTAIIDYCPRYLRHKEGSFIKDIAWRLYRSPDFIFRRKVFDNFVSNYLSLTKRYNSYDELRNNPPKTDCIIAGSDQIWNFSIPTGRDDSYFLTFADRNTIKASYAASIAQDTIPENQITRFKSALENFKEISVREQTAQKLLKEIGFNNTFSVVDPVYLLNESQWSKLYDKSFKEKGYILLYAFNCSKETADYAYQLARTKKKSLYLINTIANDFRFKADKHFWLCSPNKFLSLFHNAEEIVTNSFHGLSFSIINKKAVHVFPKKTGGNSRLFDLMKKLNVADCKNGEIINYDKVYEVLDEQIALSKNFLEKIFSYEK